MSGIGVISNPRSGHNKRNPEAVRRLGWILGEKGELSQPDGLDRLEDVILAFRQRDVDIICVHGGDGTLHKVLSALTRVYAEGKMGRELRAVRLPLIAILRGGTMNTMGRNIGLRLAADDLLGKVVVGYHAEQPLRTVERNLMVVNGTEAGFLFGTGLPARFLEAYYEGGDAGPWKAVTTLTRAIWSSIVGGPFAQSLFALEPCRVKVDGQEWEPSAYATVLGGTTADMGLGFRPFFQALSHPDHVHVIGVNGGAMSVVSKLHRIRLALPFSGPGITDQVARRFTIEADHPISYMIDGDFLRAGQTLTVEAGPRVRFIVG